MPKWGFSKGEYFYNKEKNVIAKGLSSIKFMGPKLADELYQLAERKTYTNFIDVLRDLDEYSSLDARQLDILIKLDFFSDFGNQRELLRINDMFVMFKKGKAKQIKKSMVDGTELEAIIRRHAVGTTKSGGLAKSYTLIDVWSILHEIEESIMAIGMDDLSDMVKIQNFHDSMGYYGYTSGKEEDRRKLFVMDVFEVKRKKDGKQFGYNVITKSVGSGKESRFTVFNYVFNKNPIVKGDLILCKRYERDGEYFTLTAYDKIF